MQSKDTNTYIKQIEASRLLHLINSKRNINFDDLGSKYTGSLPDSMELRYINNKYPDMFFHNKKGYLHTNSIIDVSFIQDYREEEKLDKPKCILKDGKIVELKKSYGRTILSKKNVRTKLYSEGFYIDGTHYVLFKRSTSKSRVGQCLFIDEKMLKDIQLWSRMGLEFYLNEPCDIASLMAYESLTLSSIIGTINIKPSEILVIDDFVSEFNALASVTEYDEKLKRLVVEERIEPQTSDIWDGQSLLDVSKFTGEYEGKGMLLLRNKFFKSCAFNANVQQFFEDNGINEVVDMFGVVHNAKNIKLITTPNSLKFLKFSYKLGSDFKMWDHWISDIDYDFGVCKFEKPSPFGEFNQLSYQMVNSLPLNYNNVTELAKVNINQIANINNNFDSFKEYLHIGDELDYSSEMLYNLCVVNPDVRYTKLYKNKRRTIVQTLKKNMRQGHLLVKGDYAVLVSNPLEMLKQAAGIEWNDSTLKPYEICTPMFDYGKEVTGFRNPNVCAGNVCVLKNRRIDNIEKYMNLTKNIVVINSYKNDILSRFQGADMDSDTILLINNEVVLKAAKKCMDFAVPLNKIKGDKRKRLLNKIEIAEVDHVISENLIGQIVNLSQLLNSYFWDQKSKGAFEEQLKMIYNCISILSSLSQLEIDKAKKFFVLNVRSELIKIGNTVFNENELDELKEKRRFLNNQKSLLEIQVLNSDDKSIIDKYNRVLYDLEKLKTTIDDFIDKNRIIKYDLLDFKKSVIPDDKLEDIQKLKADLKEGIIDKAQYKKEVNIIINSLEVYSKDKQIKPLFFKDNSTDKNCTFIKFNAPMDYLIEVVENIPDAKRTKTIAFDELLDQSINTKFADRKQCVKIELIAEQARNDLKNSSATYKNMVGSDDEKAKSYNLLRKEILEDAIYKLSRIKVSKIETIKSLLLRGYGSSKRIKKDSASDYKLNLVSLIYSVYPEKFLECFKQNNEKNKRCG